MSETSHEEWRPVVGFEGLYEVSELGRVRRSAPAHRAGKGRGGGARVGRVLRDQARNGGYRAVQLWREGTQGSFLVHRLVAAAFIGPCPSDREVNHVDGDKRHNAAPNLEYVTHSENNLHAYRTGLRVSIAGRPSPKRKPRVMVPCCCGCGTEIETPDSKGRARKYVSGHNNLERATR